MVGAVQENLIVGALGYVMNGFVERYPESRPAFEGVMNPVGRDYLKRTENQCIVDSLVSYSVPGAFGPEPSRALIVDGETLGHHLLTNPELKQYADRQLIGTLTPTTPALVANSTNDDAIPFSQARTLAQRWCDAGADVTSRRADVPSTVPRMAFDHLLPIPVGFLQGQNWITDRFNGIETSGCHLEGWPAARGGDIQIGAVGAMAYFRQLHMFPLGNG